MTWSLLVYVLPSLACPLMMIGCLKGMSGGKGKGRGEPADPAQRRGYLEQELARLDAERRAAAVALASLPAAADAARKGVRAAGSAPLPRRGVTAAAADAREGG